MQMLKQFLTTALLILVTVYFVQAAGGYLVADLSRLEHVEEVQMEEKIVRQKVLQLDPQEYYTIQVGSYRDAASGQARIDILAQAGYRVFVSDGPPYQLFLGCTGKVPSLEYLPEEIAGIGSDVFVQKQILNHTQFRFSEHAASQLQEVATLLTGFDVVLKHSLQLFQDYRYEVCDDENWSAMIAQVESEISQIQFSAGNLLLFAEDEQLVNDLLNLLNVLESYDESLQLIVEKKNMQVVLLAQSCLLELIAYYHNFMIKNSILDVSA